MSGRESGWQPNRAGQPFPPGESGEGAIDPVAFRKAYDERYSACYMGDEDGFAVWSHQGVELHRVTETLRQIPAREIRSVVDYGCGRGGWLPLLSTVFAEANVAGIDISEVAVRKAIDRLPWCDFLVFDGDRAPIQDGAVDLVFSYHVLEHVHEVESVATDMARLLKTGGYLCLIFPCANEGSFEERITALVKGGKEPSSDGYRRFFFEDPSHIRRLKGSEAIALFRKRGCQLLSEHYANHFFGAIERLSRLGYRHLRQYLLPHRAVSAPARLKLMALIALAALISLPVQVYLVDLSKPRRKTKQAFLYVLTPVRILGMLCCRLLQALAYREWRTQRSRKNGSAQFFVFRKPAPVDSAP